METVIEPTKSYFRINWREIAAYRDLLLLLAKRDITVTYKQTLLGPLWFVIQPVITASVFTVIFGRVAKLSTDGIPHFVFYMSGTIIWNYFTAVISQSGNSLIGNAGLLSKVYFPRLIIPFSAVVSNLAHFLMNLLIFVVIYLNFYSKGAALQPSWWLLLLPLLVAYTALVGVGFGLWVAALTTKYRDMRVALPFILQIWMYVTPIVYPASSVIEPIYKAFLWLNPLTVAVELNRFLFTGISSIRLATLGQGVVVAVIVFCSGLILFNRVQRNFVDTV